MATSPPGTGLDAPEIRPFTVSWELIKERPIILGSWWGTLWLLTLGMLLLYVPLFVMTFVLAVEQGEGVALVTILVGLVTFPILLWYVGFLLLAHQRLVLSYIDRELIGGAGAIFENLPRIGAHFWTLVILLICAFLSYTIILMPWAMGYMLVATTALSEGLPIGEAHARGMAQGAHWLRWMVLLIGEVVLVMVGSLACGVGLIVAYPMGYMAPVVIYREQYPRKRAPGIVSPPQVSDHGSMI